MREQIAFEKCLKEEEANEDVGNDNDDDNDNENDSDGAPKMECEICCMDYDFSSGLFCNAAPGNNARQHWACNTCVRQYIEKTPKAQKSSITR